MKKVIKRRSNAANDTEQIHSTDAILHNIFASRGAIYGEHNNYSLKNLQGPKLLKGLDEAIALLVNALENNQRILIVGDFDADGATSTALAVRCLQAFGAVYVDFLVPNRFIYGYGLTPEIVAVAEEMKPDLIVTVDNGISSIAGVNAAKAKGIKVLVTDHHLPGQETPSADAIVNPNQHGCEFSSKNLAGVGVIFYVMSALRSALRDKNWFADKNIPEPNMAVFLDIVALGTVADVVPLDYNNRILVATGLQRMRANKAIPGITALFNIAGREMHRLSSSDLGFAVGPRLNAAGRLDDMSLGIRCLLTDNKYEALNLAKELDDLNRDRKSIEASMQKEAVNLLQSFSDDELGRQANGVCLYKSDWHQGVIGILASRIKDRLHRPTIIFADADNGELKGSGRSIPGIHLRDVLDEVAALNPGLLEKFGGHAMAAGMSLKAEKLEQFKQAFNLVVGHHLDEEIGEPVVMSDGLLPAQLLTLDLALAIKNAGPWGQVFPEPVFDGVFYIVQQRIVGEKHLKLVLSLEPYSSNVLDAIAFNIDLNDWPNNAAKSVRIAYQLDVNEFRGNVKVQLLVSYIEAL
ncbi:single-stranded-DNA-specific exonuclease RecJ [Agarilytica rhodophyticola]|uniref:single-stranded-DNA-specific exonuclease RecJ n=1 Tax=Agarilytica rhodophyticola TaxID=1737490 RepID=UPI000B341ADF|nr:single-stranded-DNA-specific exonuclease RecJ [Agarilytica rhodophyticola]